VVGLLAVPLLATIVSPRRWRRSAGRAALPPAEPGDGWGEGEVYPATFYDGGSATPSGSTGYPIAYQRQPSPAETTAPLPGSTPPYATQVTPTESAWPVRENPADSESTRKLP
jgi:hypothetical protein